MWSPSDDIVPAYKDAFLKTYFSEPITDDTENCADALEFPESGKLTVLVEYSPTEFQKILDCVLQGAVIIYPNEVRNIWWSFVRQLDCPMDFCQMVLDCIETTPAIQQSIASYSNSSSITQTTPEQQTILDTDIFGNQGPCDEDEIFGMTRQMANFLNQVSMDILEIFVTAFAIPGRIGDIIEAIPGLGVLPYDDLLQALEKIAEQVNDSYVAAYDTQINEDIACDLFCIAKITCTLIMEQARDYFQDKVTTALDNTDILHVIEDIIANNWIGEQSIYMFHWFILDTIIFGGETLGVDTNRMVTTIATYFNDPDSDWSTLCTSCGWAESWLDGDGDIEPDWTIILGTYDSGDDDLDSEFNGTSSELAYAEYVFTQQTTVTKIEYDGRLVKNSTFNRQQLIRRVDVDTTVTNLAETTPTGTGIKTFTLTFTGSEVFEIGDKIQFWASVSISPASTCEVKRLLVEGDGSNPF